MSGLPRLSISTLLVVGLGLSSFGCSGGGSSGGGGANTSSDLCSTGEPRYWHVNDTCGNAYESADSNEATLAGEILTLVNQARAGAGGGLSPLSLDSGAVEAAQVHAEDMQGRNYHSHTSPEGWDPGDRLTFLSVSNSGWGENIAYGTSGSVTAQDIFNGWMASQGHQDNILNPAFTHIGIGVAEEGSNRTYWCQVFLTK